MIIVMQMKNFYKIIYYIKDGLIKIIILMMKIKLMKKMSRWMNKWTNLSMIIILDMKTHKINSYFHVRLRIQ